MPFGFQDTQWIQFPEGQENDRLATLQNKLGINWLEFIRRVDAAMNALNGTDPMIERFCVTTTQDHINAPGTSSKVWMRGGEYIPGRPQRGRAGRGWYLPLYHMELDLGFTDRALRVMPLQQFNDELRETVTAVQIGRRADVLERLFSATEWPLDDDGNGASPGFAGSGTGTNAFVGRLPSGALTSGSYTHYFQADNTDASIEATVNAMVDRLDNFNQAPYDFEGSVAATERLMAIVGNDQRFISSGSTLVRPGTEVSEAMVDANLYLGVFAGVVRVRKPNYQIEGLNFVIYKSGSKPLAWRYDPIFGRDAYVDDRRLMPLTEAAIMQSYGIGAWDRTAAAVCSIGGTAGVYAPPVIVR